MKIIRKILAGTFLTIGLGVLILGTNDLIDRKKTNEDKEGALAAIVILGLPSTAFGTWIIWNLQRQHQKELQQLYLKKEQMFLQLLEQEQGRITITKFALYAQIPIEESKQFLEEKAKQLNANYETSEKAGIIYIFPE
jgi:predicted HTH domain antitoxin